MPDYAELLNTIKQAATEAVEAGKPVQVCFGKVINTSPIQILVDQKMILGSAQLVLARNVTDFETNVSIEWESETKLGSHTHLVNLDTNSGDNVLGHTGPISLAHAHEIVGSKKMKIHNALEKGEEVILLRMQGGQKYIVLDRIGGG